MQISLNVILEWIFNYIYMYNKSVQYGDIVFNNVIVEISLTRRSQYYVINYYLPISTITALTSIGLFTPDQHNRDRSDRVSYSPPQTRYIHIFRLFSLIIHMMNTIGIALQ